MDLGGERGGAIDRAVAAFDTIGEELGCHELSGCDNR